ncbi:hypothetical protein HYDPIDRAFT_169298 [Hydnomerulius pinastri MD-312]|uniref:Nephrocystin 3-like N-terminal domain-containing protein n=1 Tax=Hydnomerulius pinastri MD-312 TaxID=994086 RepID=A0A0C9V8Y3_9AGAM|nr:hypothetical protein HYDPIDRAFT_169298 [Hydnomerulius pinastri MD-312]
MYLLHPPKIGHCHFDDRFYVQINVGDRIMGTSTISRKSDSAHESSIIAFHVYAHRKIHHNAYLGTIQGSLALFLAHPGALYPLSNEQSENPQDTQFSFSVKRVAEAVERHQTIPRVDTEHTPNRETHPGPSCLPAELRGSCLTGSEVDMILSDAKALKPLLDKINNFLLIVEGFSEIHPYAKIASTLITTVYKIVAAQALLKRNFENLVNAITDAYYFLSEAKPLETIQSHQKIMSLLSLQTVECMYFIRDHMSKKACQKVWNHILINNIENKIQTYIGRFQQLKDSLQQHAAIHTAKSVLRLYDEVQGLGSAAQMSLDAMPYTGDVHYRNAASCKNLAPHLTEVVGEITEWVSGQTEKHIYFLSGPENSGKTVVASEVSRLFDKLQRLGSSYFIPEPHPTHPNYPQDPSNLFRTISLDIADQDPQFKHALAEAVKRRHIRSTSDVSTQFAEFILRPAQEMRAAGPVLVVIDGLDRCGNEASRKDILTMLARESSELPDNFRVLVTSRPDKDIVDAFTNRGQVLMKIIENLTLSDSDSGISFSPGKTPGKHLSESLTEPTAPPRAGSILEEHHTHYLDPEELWQSSSDTSPATNPSPSRRNHSAVHNSRIAGKLHCQTPTFRVGVMDTTNLYHHPIVHATTLVTAHIIIVLVCRTDCLEPPTGSRLQETPF